MTNRFFSFLIASVFMLSGSAQAGGTLAVVEEIPTLSEWGFIIMGIGLLSLGVRFLRRRGLSDVSSN